jgi:hypothetical protein
MAKVLTPDDIQGSAENRDDARDAPRRLFSARQLAAAVSLALAAALGWRVPALLANQRALLDLPLPSDVAKPDAKSGKPAGAPLSLGQSAALQPAPQATPTIVDRPIVIAPLPVPNANSNGAARLPAPPIAPERVPTARPEQHATAPIPPMHVKPQPPPAPTRPAYQYPHNEWQPGMAPAPFFRGPLMIRPRPGVPWRPGGFGHGGAFGRR